MTSTEPPGGTPSDKVVLRARLLAARRAMPPKDAAAAGVAACRLLLWLPELRRARRVAAYASVGSEPATGLLLDTLVERGATVLLPVLCDDLDLDWAEYSGAASMAPGGLGLREPTGGRLGTDAVGAVDAVVCPGLAVDRAGMRLGRGGGSYDRALSRLPTDAWSCVLLYADEVLDRVPADAHDQPVHAAVTPVEVVRFSV